MKLDPTAATQAGRQTRTKLFVAAAWFALFAAAIAFVLHFASTMPILGDFALMPELLGAKGLSLKWLWQVYNDHRIPIPKLILASLFRATHGEFRVPMIIDVALLGLASAAAIAAVRRARGSASPFEAVFPVLWLNWGHSENMLIGFQTTLVLPTALAAIATCVAVCSPRPTRRSAAILCACLVPLPFTSGAGILHVPCLAAWTAIAGVAGLRSQTKPERRTGAMLLAAAALAIAGAALYVLGFVHADDLGVDTRWTSRLTTCAQFASTALGPGAFATWPWSAVVVAAITSASVIRLAVIARDRAAKRLRAAALLAAIGSIVLTAIVIGWSRPDGTGVSGFMLRYVTLTTPLLAAVMMTWHVFPPRSHASTVRAALFALCVAIAVAGARSGLEQGREIASITRDLVTDVRAGMSSTELAVRHQPKFGDEPREFAELMAMMRARRVGPFRECTWRADVDLDRVGPFAALSIQPTRGTPSNRIVSKVIGGREVVVAPVGGELTFAVTPGAKRLHAEFGVVLQPNKARLEIAVEARDRDGNGQILFTRSLDPETRTSDRGPQTLRVELPADAVEFVLRSKAGGEQSEHAGRTWWTGVSLE